MEYLEARYGNSVRGLIAVSGILIKFIDLGIKLFAISIVVHVVTGWEVVPVIVVSGLITIAYVFIGGLWATVLTDLVQFVVQLVMSLAVLFIVLDMVGGWNAMWDSLPQERAGFFNAAEGISVSFWLVYVVVIILSYNGGTWGLAQRFVSVEKPRDAQKAALLSAILYLFYPIVIFVPAWAAPLLMPEYFDPVTLQPVDGFDLDQTYILVTQKILSTSGTRADRTAGMLHVCRDHVHDRQRYQRPCRGVHQGFLPAQFQARDRRQGVVQGGNDYNGDFRYRGSGDRNCNLSESGHEQGVFSDRKTVRRPPVAHRDPIDARDDMETPDRGGAQSCRLSAA